MKNNKTILLTIFAVATTLNLLSISSLCAMQKLTEKELRKLHEKFTKCIIQRQKTIENLLTICDEIKEKYSHSNHTGLYCIGGAFETTNLRWKENGCADIEEALKTSKS